MSNKDVSEVSLTYKVKEEIPKLKWTAYKFSYRTEVSGIFEEISYKPIVKEGTVKQLLKGSTFTIHTASINSNLRVRDLRIFNYFFSTLDAQIIKGKFLEVNNTFGKVSLQMGKHTYVNDFTYAILDDKIMILTSINLEFMTALSGVEALNKVCKVEHTGSDGISKLWSDVDVTVEIALKQI